MISLAADEAGRPQPVEVTVRGLRYPGEVVVTRFWAARLGEPLRGHAMFRLVLLTEACAVAPAEIQDRRIAVAVPSSAGDAGLERLNTEARALQETRARYAVAADPGLDRLAGALRGRLQSLEREMAARMRGRWAAGTIAVAAGSHGWPPASVQLIFASDDPQVWVEGLAGALIIARYEGPAAADPPDQVHVLTPEALRQAGDRLTSAPQTHEAVEQTCPVRQRLVRRGWPGRDPAGFWCALEVLDGLMAGGDVRGDRLRETLVHEFGVPPDAASLCLINHLVTRDSEIVLTGDAELKDRRGANLDCPRLTADVVPGMEWTPHLLDWVAAMRPVVSDEWDSALPYLRLILPDARPSGHRGGGPARQGTAFAEALETLEGRFTLALGVLDRLERRLGETGRTVNVQSERLFIVLSAASWREFFARARGEFRSVEALRKALDELARSRRAGEEALAIERCARYLEEAQFGPDERDLNVEARTLRARIDLRALVDNPGLWPPILEEFQRWRAEYRKAYLKHHAARRALSRQMQQRAERAERRMDAAERLGRIPELAPPPEPSLRSRWDQLRSAVTVCQASDEGIPLVDHPWCAECRVALGAPPAFEDVEGAMAEIERTLGGYNERLRSAAVRDILAGRRREEVEKLLAIVGVGDMSALTGVLDDDVVRFLSEFMRGAESTRRTDRPE